VKVLDGCLGRAFLRLGPPLADLRRLPLIGPCLRWASAKLVPRDSLAWVQVQHGAAKGILLHLNPRTGSGYFNADVEPEVQAVLEKYLHSGMTFYDVGANIGFFSLLAARLVGEQGSVVAFEADPEIASRLRENISRNQKATISVEEKTAWSSSTPMLFALGRNGFARSRPCSCARRAARGSRARCHSSPGHHFGRLCVAIQIPRLHQV
jgi:Met-10+ like-protein